MDNNNENTSEPTITLKQHRRIVGAHKAALKRAKRSQSAIEVREVFPDNIRNIIAGHKAAYTRIRRERDRITEAMRWVPTSDDLTV